jgi:hypothetical protein
MDIFPTAVVLHLTPAHAAIMVTRSSCSPGTVTKYQERVSGSLLEHIDFDPQYWFWR